MIALMISCSAIFVPNKTEAGKIQENSKAMLPVGAYFLCCQGGLLNLYNIIGVLVGQGTNCGEWTGCHKVVITNSIMQNPDNWQYVLGLINSMKPKTGPAHTGDWPTTYLTYYFKPDQINW